MSIRNFPGILLKKSRILKIRIRNLVISNAARWYVDKRCVVIDMELYPLLALSHHTVANARIKALAQFSVEQLEPIVICDRF